MQFNSYIFIFCFLPAFVLIYHISDRINRVYARYVTILAGGVFYLCGGKVLFLIFILDCILNFCLSVAIDKSDIHRKTLYIISLIANILPLFCFKYLNFVIVLFNDITGNSFQTRSLVLPLGISFFTFQQIMYLANVYKGDLKYRGFADYLTYIFFFPKIIMGPLVEPDYLLEQFYEDKSRGVNWDHLAEGMKIFSFGLFKKMVLADTFSKAVGWGFQNIEAATSGDFFLVMLFYTFEIYFDFSGYTDMAIGISKMINIDLPINFNSPYKALSIIDFWKRWHISLTTFFTKYIYFPLGGSKKGKIRTYVNIMVVFLVSGLWHGASWTFILWGMIYGLLQVVERIGAKCYRKISEAGRWLYTFFMVNVLWLLFRAESVSQWKALLYKMLAFKNMAVSDGLIQSFILPETQFILDALKMNALNSAVRGLSLLVFTTLSFGICLIPENNYRTQQRLTTVNLILAIGAFVWSVLCLSHESVFVYFNF